jgi:hypothetical protein
LGYRLNVFSKKSYPVAVLIMVQNPCNSPVTLAWIRRFYSAKPLTVVPDLLQIQQTFQATQAGKCGVAPAFVVLFCCYNQAAKSIG